MSPIKRPSTSSLRRFITSRPYVTVAEIRRRFALDDPDAISHVSRNGTSGFVGLPEREALKLQDLWQRDEIGLEFSVEVRAPVVVGVFPMRIARFVMDQASASANGHVNGQHIANGHGPMNDRSQSNGHDPVRPAHDGQPRSSFPPLSGRDRPEGLRPQR